MQVPDESPYGRRVARATLWLVALPVLTTVATYVLAAPVGDYVDRILGTTDGYPLWLLLFTPTVMLIWLVTHLAIRAGKQTASAVGWGISAGLISAALTIGSFFYALATCNCLD
jgi:hypothetical protein